MMRAPPWIRAAIIVFFSAIHDKVVVSSNQNDGNRIGLRIIHITDVYTLKNFPSLKTLINEKTPRLNDDDDKNNKYSSNVTTISVLTGDFLMPYLLSSVDGGRGMMKMMNEIPINYLTWGNHEKDLPHEQLMEREKEYRGIWINTNMQSHESYKNSTCQKDYEIIDLIYNNNNNGDDDADDHRRRIAFIGILTNSPSLYPPGSFNGAIIDDPWDTMHYYQKKLSEMEDENVDLIIPLCHLYEAQDERTASEFDFPLILGGHDHHTVDRVINGTMLLKPGSDAHFARVIDIYWENSSKDTEPVIEHELLRVSDYEPDLHLQDAVEKAYSALDPLRLTQLGFIPQHIRPLSSKGARESRVSIAIFLGGEICDAINSDSNIDENNNDQYHSYCDTFITKGGNIRGGYDYDDDQEYTLELLLSELQDVTIYVAELPGSILRVGLRETWQLPGTGWFQHDDNIVTDDGGYVISVRGEPLQLDRIYRIATMEDFFRSRDGPSIGKYYEEEQEETPYEKPVRIRKITESLYDLLLKHAARKCWQTIATKIDVDGNIRNINKEEFDMIDKDNSGYINRDEMMEALQQYANLQTHKEEYKFVDYVLHVIAAVKTKEKNSSRVTNTPNTRTVSLQEIKIYFDERLSSWKRIQESSSDNNNSSLLSMRSIPKREL